MNVKTTETKLFLPVVIQKKIINTITIFARMTQWAAVMFVNENENENKEWKANQNEVEEKKKKTHAKNKK